MKIEIDDKATVIIDELGEGERVVIPRAPNQTDEDLPPLGEFLKSNETYSEGYEEGFDKGWDSGYNHAVNRMKERLLTWDEITK